VNDITRTSKEIVRAFRNAVDRFLTSASNPGRAAAVVHDNTPGSPYHDLVMAKIEIDAVLDWPAADEPCSPAPLPTHDGGRYRKEGPTREPCNVLPELTADSCLCQDGLCDACNNLLAAIKVRSAPPPVPDEVERMRKLFYLAAQEVIFFSAYDEKTDSWPKIDLFYAPCVNLSDTFAYACADGQRLDDSEIDRLIEAHKRWGYDGVVAWASLIRKCEPIEPRRTVPYYAARGALTKSGSPT